MHMEAFTYKHIAQQAERYLAGCLLENMCLYDTPDPNKDPTNYRLLRLFILQQIDLLELLKSVYSDVHMTEQTEFRIAHDVLFQEVK